MLLFYSSVIFITYYVNDKILRARRQHLSIMTEAQCSDGPAEKSPNIIKNFISKCTILRVDHHCDMYTLLVKPCESPSIEEALLCFLLCPFHVSY